MRWNPLRRAAARLRRHKQTEETVAFAIALDVIWNVLLAGGIFAAGLASAATFSTTSTYHPSYSLSPKAIVFVERHEGVRSRPYPDPGGRHICTVGAGHVLSWTIGCTAQQLATTYSPAQIAAFLKSDTNTARSCITREVTAHIGQPEYEALVDLVFNAGCGSLYYRNVVGLINAGETWRLPAAWESTAVTASGVYLGGLAQRRIDEVTLYTHHYYGAGIGYFVAPKPLTAAQKAEAKLRAKVGYYAWLAWYLHEGAWRQYAVHASIVRPHVPARAPASWWVRERAFVKARQA